MKTFIQTLVIWTLFMTSVMGVSYAQKYSVTSASGNGRYKVQMIWVKGNWYTVYGKNKTGNLVIEYNVSGPNMYKYMTGQLLLK